VGLDPVTPGTRSVILLNRPGGPSGPVGNPSDFITLTAFDPVPELGGLTQLFEIFFQSENALAFDVNVLTVQATGAPEIFSTGAFQDLSGALLLDTSAALTILVGSEGFGPTSVRSPLPGCYLRLGPQLSRRAACGGVSELRATAINKRLGGHRVSHSFTRPVAICGLILSSQCRVCKTVVCLCNTRPRQTPRP
jgi:hypothetical protein